VPTRFRAISHHERGSRCGWRKPIHSNESLSAWLMSPAFNQRPLCTPSCTTISMKKSVTSTTGVRKESFIVRSSFVFSSGCCYNFCRISNNNGYSCHELGMCQSCNLVDILYSILVVCIKRIHESSWLDQEVLYDYKTDLRGIGNRSIVF